MESDRRATADDEECKHHLVNRRVLFPSPSAPIGLRGHGGRSSSSSYFIRSSVHAPPRAMLSLSVHVIAVGTRRAHARYMLGFVLYVASMNLQVGEVQPRPRLGSFY